MPSHTHQDVRGRTVKYTGNRGARAEEGVIFLLAGLALAGFAAYNREWFREIMTGPVAASPDELSQAKSLQSLPSRYVRLPVAEYKETGVRRVLRRRGVQVTEYVLIRVADRWLPAAMDPGPRPKTVVGYLGALQETGSGSCWDPDALPEIARRVPAKYSERMLPFRLDAKQDYDVMGRALLYGSVGLSLLSFALAGFYFWKLAAKSPGEVPAGEMSAFVPTSGKSPAAEAWRWR
jgi:hypothetical protein